jgi:hypothetical protein
VHGPHHDQFQGDIKPALSPVVDAPSADHHHAISVGAQESRTVADRRQSGCGLS